jgi:hypothetical protein
MTANERLFAKLTDLLAKGELAKSQCSNSLLRLLRPLFNTDVIGEHRSGSGRKLVVRDRLAFEAFVHRNFPDDQSPSELPLRAAGVRRFRDSKTFSTDDPPLIHIRAWHGEILRKDGEACCADLDTKIHSVFSFQVGANYSLCGSCALVENPAVFRHFENLGLKIPLVIYGQGRVSNRVLRWLEGQSQPQFSLTHLPDYDPAGLSEFERLRRALGPRVCLYLPNGLDQLFERYSNRRLLQKTNSQRLLSNLRRSTSVEVRRVVELIHRHNAGLEQEALLSADSML